LRTYLAKIKAEKQLKLPIYAHFDDRPQVYVLPIDIPYEEMR
jgi:hypothetical protein